MAKPRKDTSQPDGKRMAFAMDTKSALGGNKSPARPMGRPSAFSPEVVEAICTRLIEGESLRAICASDDMPHRNTVTRWIKENEDFQVQYARARELQADFIADEIIEIADEDCVVVRREGEVERLEIDSAAVMRNRLRVDARKWMAAKLQPKKYGDKLAVGQADDLLPLVMVKDLTGRKDR